MGASGFAPGTVFADRYRMVALVGRGGMGEVYRADDMRLGQPVALKFLPPELEASAEARGRLLAEVRSARSVSHPNVCRVYDVGEAHGRVFLTMEFIDGENLASLLRRIGRLPSGKALEVARQLCAGLAAAHAQGVLHRDLKPANVMIDGRGHARITDFGLAGEVEDAGAAVPRGVVRGLADLAGTIAYMAPERFEGAPASVQSDLYALGLVLYEVYTGKPALNATTLEGWRLAHSDSRPSHPSALVAEIEPTVERAILRCLEKDPASRPASAAQLGASLPGGDPLAAAVAAGETPSPALVAASGQEGTLPRRQAWMWFVSCLAALALAVPLGGLTQLANLTPLQAPIVQAATARRTLERLGYTMPPADAASWFRADDGYLTALAKTRPPSEWHSSIGSKPGAIVFCYRESQGHLFTWDPFGDIRAFDPAPRYPEDVYLELDGQGRLVTLRAGGLGFRRPAAGASRPTDWSVAFSAAGLDMGAFTETTAATWPAVLTADESRAWVGRAGGSVTRVEASAYRGRTVQFLSFAEREPDSIPARRSTLERALALFSTMTVFACLGVLAVLARRNLRLGRGDRKGAYRLAMAVVAAETIFVLFRRHWTFQPLDLLGVLVYLLGLPLFAGAQTWLFYVGIEPILRRRWPHLLIAWTRLLDGRWRDPLVGRSLLAGAGGALLAAGIAPGILSALTRAFSLPLILPRYTTGSLDGGLAWFLATDTSGWVGPVYALMSIAVLLVARLTLRHDFAAWSAWLLVGFGMHAWESLYSQPWAGAAPAGPLILAAATSAGVVAVMAKEGLLAGAAFYTVWVALDMTPLTQDPSWYAWRTGVVVALIAGLAVWGFLNVLGRQSAFPAGALDQ